MHFFPIFPVSSWPEWFISRERCSTLLQVWIGVLNSFTEFSLSGKLLHKNKTVYFCKDYSNAGQCE